MPKVSVVVPIYNVEKYLRKCLDSLISQTLRDIEIICVNDGSKDSSPDIIREYKKKDPRIIMIDKENSGYGDSMNQGFARASGEYIGILESDDYAEPDMYEKLYHIASKNQLDVVKSSFYYYYSVPKEKNIKEEIVSSVMAGKTICPRESFQSRMEKVAFFNIKPTIWSAIYRRAFIEENKITFNPTPGASFQDASFNFKVWCCAERVQLIRDAFVHYRQDNENSSVNSVGKVFCVCDEYQEMERFLNEHPVWKKKMEYIRTRIKYDSYIWNYERIAQKYKYLFIERASEEFRSDLEKDYLNKNYFEDYKWDTLELIIEDPVAYHTSRSVGDWEEKNSEYFKVIKSPAYRIGRAITAPFRVLELLSSTIKCCKENGFIYTVKYIKSILLGEKYTEL